MPPDLVILVFGAFAAAFVVGAAGFGDALICTAIWLHVLAPQEAVPLIVATGLTIQIIVLSSLRRGLDFRRLWPFLIAGAVGVPVGVWLLSYADPESFRSVMGTFLVVYGLVFLLVRNIPAATRGGRPLDGAVGGIGGVLGGLAGLSGFIPAMWCAQRGWPRDQARGVTQPYILAMHGMALAWLAIGGLVTEETGWNYLYILPGIAAGCWLGLRCYGKLDDMTFRKLVLAMLVVSGLMLLAETIGQLL